MTDESGALHNDGSGKRLAAESAWTPLGGVKVGASNTRLFLPHPWHPVTSSIS